MEPGGGRHEDGDHLRVGLWNTQLVAEELAGVAREHGDVDLVRAEEAGAGTVGGADLVLVGGPTHLHGMSTRATRQSGLASADTDDEPLGPDVPGAGLRDWFRLSGRVDVRPQRRSTLGSTDRNS